MKSWHNGKAIARWLGKAEFLCVSLPPSQGTYPGRTVRQGTSTSVLQIYSLPKTRVEAVGHFLTEPAAHDSPCRQAGHRQDSRPRATAGNFRSLDPTSTKSRGSRTCVPKFPANVSPDPGAPPSIPGRQLPLLAMFHLSSRQSKHTVPLYGKGPGTLKE